MNAELEALVARRVRGGGNHTDSAALLAELIAAHEGINLESALLYHGFAATPRIAEKVVASLTSHP